MRLARAAEWLLLAAVLVAPWPYGSAADGARYALTGVLLVAGALWLCGLGHSGTGVPRLLVIAAALPLVAFVQLVTGRSVSPIATAESAAMLLAAAGVVAFWSERARDRAAANRLAVTILAVCCMQAAFGAVQWSLAPDRIYGQAAPIVTMPFGSFVNHNHFAGLVEMGALLALGMAYGLLRKRGEASPQSVALAGVALALVAAHLASRSRGGLLALTAGAVLCGFGFSYVTRERPRAMKAAAVAVLCAVAIVGFGAAAVSRTARQQLATIMRGPDGSANYRLDTASATLRLALSRPLFGSGLGAYADAVPQFKRAHGDVRTTHAESDILEFCAESGLAGIAAACWLGVAILAGVRERVLEGRDPYRKALTIGAAAAAATLLAHGLIDFNLRIPSNVLVFASLLGLAAAAPRTSESSGGSRRSGVAAALFLLFALVSFWRAAGAQMLDAALAERDPNARIGRLSGTLALHPYLAEARRARGVVWRDLAVAAGPLRASRLARAEADLVAATRLRPNWGEAWADLGWVRAMRGDLRSASADLDRGASLDPTHAGIALARAELSKRTQRR
jgi:O-antigen ligase